MRKCCLLKGFPSFHPTSCNRYVGSDVSMRHIVIDSWQKDRESEQIYEQTHPLFEQLWCARHCAGPSHICHLSKALQQASASHIIIIGSSINRWRNGRGKISFFGPRLEYFVEMWKSPRWKRLCSICVVLSCTREVPEPTGLSPLLLIRVLGQRQHFKLVSRILCVKPRGQS